MVCLQTEKAEIQPTLSRQEPTTTSGLQRFLLIIYRLTSWTGVLSTRFGRRIYAAAYDLYKSRWEATQIAALKAFVRPGTTVVDVGANIGFFTRRFAEWVRPGGLVLAIEPEKENLAGLADVLSRRGLVNVEPIQAVAAERAGTLRLQINRFHPADHRISDVGTEVPAITVDGLIAQRGWPEVSLLKIDVQGAEERVLLGALEVLRRARPTVFMEVDEAALAAMGSSAQKLLRLMAEEGYQVCRMDGGKLTPPLPVEHVLSLCRSGTYADFIFVPKG